MNRKCMTAIVLVTACVFLIGGTSWAKTWNVPKDFKTLTAAMKSPKVKNGDTIKVAKGKFVGTTVIKDVTLQGAGGTATKITGVKVGKVKNKKVGFYVLKSGASITGFNFTSCDMGVYGDTASNISVQNCTFTSCIQAITNWDGNKWIVKNNTINKLRQVKAGTSWGGLGIVFIAELEDILSSTVSGNKVKGSYNGFTPTQTYGLGAGIALQTLSNNVFLKNVTVSANTISLSRVGGELGAVVLDQKNDSTKCVSLKTNKILNNKVGSLDIYVKPAALEGCNTFNGNVTGTDVAGGMVLGDSAGQIAPY